ncbi:MAG: FlgD immunoglobulin-like domain containing protein [Candidatus Latescibacterota bacterium]
MMARASLVDLGSRRGALAGWLVVGVLGWAQAEGASVSAPAVQVVPQGTEAAVLLSVTDAGSNVVGVDLVLRYNEAAGGDILTFVRLETAGTALSGWTVERNPVANVAGGTDEIRISAASPGAPLPSTGTLTLLRVVFQAAEATAPRATALDLVSAELNEAGVTAVDGLLKLGGTSGVVTLTPDPIRPSQALNVSLADADLEGTGSAAVEVTSRTAGGGVKETQTLTLAEGPAGVFSGRMATRYGTGAAANGDTLEIVPGEQIQASYTDAFDVAGNAGIVVVDETAVVGGQTAMVEVAPAAVASGADVTVSVVDLDLAGGDGVAAQVLVNRPGTGVVQTEVVGLTETPAGSGRFSASVPTGTSPAGGTLQLGVEPGDQIFARYDDPVGDSGEPVPGILSLTPTVAAFTVPAVIEVTDTLRIALSDVDLTTGTRVSGGPARITVTVTNTSTGETESVLLTETPPLSGSLTGGLTTAFRGSGDPAPGIGTLGVKPGDALQVSGTDVLAPTGSVLVTSGEIAVEGGTTGLVSTLPGALDPPTPVEVRLEDEDLRGRGTAQVEVIVRRPGGQVEVELVTLVESPVGSGIFLASVPTSLSATPASNGTLEVQPGDRILVRYADAIGGDDVPVPGVLSLVPTSASFTLPPSLKVADDLAIALGDADLAAGTRVNGAATATVTVTNTRTDESETVVLVEGAAGQFSGVLATAYDDGTAPYPGPGILGVKPDDGVVVSFDDGLGAGGVPVTVASPPVPVVGGSDAVLVTSPAQITPGQAVTFGVTDGDLSGGTLSVKALVLRGGAVDSQLVVLSFAGGQFSGAVPTQYGVVARVGNDTLEVRRDDQITFRYRDEVTSQGAPTDVFPAAPTAVLGGVTGQLTVSAAVQAGDGLRIELADADLNTSPSAVDQVTVTATNPDAGDEQAVALQETGPNTGVFRAVPPLPTSASGTEPGTLRVVAHDTIAVSYADVLDDDGGAAAVSAPVAGVLWGDTSDNGKVGALDASQILQRGVGLLVFNPYQERVGNVNGSTADGFVPPPGYTAQDATLVLQYIVGLIDVFPVQSGVPVPHPYKPVVGQRQIALGEPELAGVRLSVPVLLDQRQGVLSAQLRIAFDAEGYRISGVELDGEASQYLVASNVVDGVLLVAMAGAAPAMAGPGAILHIQAEATGSAEPAAFRIESAGLNGGELEARPVAALALAPQPRDFALLPNVPNPFNPETLVRYRLAAQTPVRLEVFDMLGQRVRTLVEQTQAAGIYQVAWDGRDGRGEAVGSGVYLCRLEAGSFVMTRKMALMR